MENLDKKDVLPVIKNLLEKIDIDGTVEVYAYEREALKQIIDQYGTKERPMSAYFSLENWLYDQKNKPVELQSAMLWGGLWVVKELGCIDWNTMREMYGEFMSKKMNLR